MRKIKCAFETYTDFNREDAPCIVFLIEIKVIPSLGFATSPIPITNLKMMS